uniref:Uncharacterized protein n=1 Tax=viral metagenome TaxID=1070528 RepID=A0A6C0BQX9_9ZZZZ
MLLDDYLTFEQKIYISLIFSSIWIYFRTLGCYAALPRQSIVSVILVCIWMYLNYYEPLSAPIGLIIMYLYSLLSGGKVKL